MTKSTQTSETTGATPDPLDRVVRIGMLVDLYGGLLTERQRSFVQLHYNDDLSFGEIARNHGVSRQAVHDAVKHAEGSLEEYEAKLGLLERGVGRSALATPPPTEAPNDDPAPASAAPALDREGEAALESALARLRALQDKLRRSGGIIYNADGVTREVGEIADALERLAGKS